MCATLGTKLSTVYASTPALPPVKKEKTTKERLKKKKTPVGLTWNWRYFYNTVRNVSSPVC